MPKVSAEHLAARRLQITAAAARLVAERGVHAMTMRDAIAASGLSAGAVYHYFPTKAELLDSIGDYALGRYRGLVAKLLDRGGELSPGEVVEGIAAALAGPGELEDLSGIGIAMWSEALTHEQIAVSMRRVITGLRDQLTDLAGRWVEAGRLPSGTDPTAVAGTLYALIPGYLVQRHLAGGVSPQSLRAGLDALIGWSEAS